MNFKHINNQVSFQRVEPSLDDNPNCVMERHFLKQILPLGKKSLQENAKFDA